MSRRLVVVTAVLLGTVIGAGGATLAAFSDTTTNPGNSFSSQSIYEGTRTTSAWAIDDAADGSSSDGSDPISFADGLYYRTGTWSTSFSASRYLDIELSSPLPAGLAATSASFEFDFADDDSSSGDDICFYFEVRKASTGAVLGTHGSARSPIACETGTTPNQTSTAIAEVADSDIANDLLIRIFAATSIADQMRLHRAAVTFVALGHTWTLNEMSLDDGADGSAVLTPWKLAFDDGVEFQNLGNWAMTFQSNRYITFSFPAAHVPTGADVQSASFTHTFRAEDSGDTFCYWFELYSGTDLLGTHGSAGSPLECRGNTAVTVTESLPEIDSGANADELAIKLYGRLQSPSDLDDSRHDRVELSVGYSLT